MTVWVVTADHDPYGCGCQTVHAICATEAIAKKLAAEYEKTDRMIQTFIDEMVVLQCEL